MHPVSRQYFLWRSHTDPRGRVYLLFHHIKLLDHIGLLNVYMCVWVVFTPQPLRLWGIVITRGGRAGVRAFRNSALTEKLTDEFCLFFTHMTYVPGQFIPYIFFCHQAKSGHFPRCPPKKLVGTITYEPSVGLHSNLV